MSHSKERKEKICLNCNTELNGRYCHACGQENIEPKDSVWGLVSHFFYDITHFDGKFFSTTGILFRRPGLLPKEYIAGKRARYLHPIRMYVFASAFFFLVFFSMYSARNINLGAPNDGDESGIQTARERALKGAETREDSVVIARVFDKWVPATGVESQKADTTNKSRKKARKDDKYNWNVGYDESKYKTTKQYDSAQNALPEAQRDGWWETLKERRGIEINEKYKGNKTAFIRELIDKFMHTFPYLLFISLPLYALFLKLLYIRHKQFYYVDHGIFLVYLYIFTFLFLLVYFGLVKTREALDWEWIGWIEAGLIIYGIYYAFRAMRKFYLQGRALTLLKFFLLNVLATISMLILFVLFFIFAVFRV